MRTNVLLTGVPPSYIDYGCRGSQRIALEEISCSHYYGNIFCGIRRFRGTESAAFGQNQLLRFPSFVGCLDQVRRPRPSRRYPSRDDSTGVPPAESGGMHCYQFLFTPHSNMFGQIL
jgi:hypothetical protein